MLSLMTLMLSFQDLFMAGFFFLLQNCHALNSLRSFQNSLSLTCTNYFFELEHEDGLMHYGPSKEHRPNPIVQMGLFMNKSGIPLAFCINPGNQNEQLSLKPLEQQIMRNFEFSKFVVCTDAGLSSDANRRFNNFGERSFITTQSIKKLKRSLKEWCLDCNDWDNQAFQRIIRITQNITLFTKNV